MKGIARGLARQGRELANSSPGSRTDRGRWGKGLKEDSQGR